MNSRRPLLLAADAAGDPRRFLYGYDTANIGSALNFVPYGLPGLAQGYVVACCARQDSLRLLMRPCGTCPTRLTSIMPRSPADINHTAAAAVPISGLTARQACSSTQSPPEAGHGRAEQQGRGQLLVSVGSRAVGRAYEP